jgi:hypothetical protein
MSLRNLAESSSGCARIDRENGVIRGVRVLGKVSRNGREYSDRAMNDAVKHYEGVNVNIDHDLKNSSNRGLAQSFGVLKKVRRDGDAVYADLHYLKSHPLAEVVLERAERFPERFGMSHASEGQAVQRGSVLVVETIERVHSVDLVLNPATNESLFESEQGRAPQTYEEFIAAIKGDNRRGFQLSPRQHRQRLHESTGSNPKVRAALDRMYEQHTPPCVRGLINKMRERRSLNEADEGDIGGDDSAGPDTGIDAAFEEALMKIVQDRKDSIPNRIKRIETLLYAFEDAEEALSMAGLSAEAQRVEREKQKLEKQQARESRKEFEINKKKLDDEREDD